METRINRLGWNEFLLLLVFWCTIPKINPLGSDFAEWECGVGFFSLSGSAQLLACAVSRSLYDCCSSRALSVALVIILQIPKNFGHKSSFHLIPPSSSHRACLYTFLLGSFKRRSVCSIAILISVDTDSDHSRWQYVPCCTRHHNVLEQISNHADTRTTK